MYIKSYADLADHPKGDVIKKALNKHIHKRGAEFCIFLPSHMMDTADFLDTFTAKEKYGAVEALNRYSPFELRLILQAMGSEGNERKTVKEKVRLANRQTARFISSQIEKHETSLMTKIKKVFK